MGFEKNSSSGVLLDHGVAILCYVPEYPTNTRSDFLKLNTFLIVIPAQWEVEVNSS